MQKLTESYANIFGNSPVPTLFLTIQPRFIYLFRTHISLVDIIFKLDNFKIDIAAELGLWTLTHKWPVIMAEAEVAEH